MTISYNNDIISVTLGTTSNLLGTVSFSSSTPVCDINDTSNVKITHPDLSLLARESMVVTIAGETPADGTYEQNSNDE